MMNMNNKNSMNPDMMKQQMYMNPIDYGSGYQMYGGAFSEPTNYMPMKGPQKNFHGPMQESNYDQIYHNVGSDWQYPAPQPQMPYNQNKMYHNAYPHGKEAFSQNSLDISKLISFDLFS